MELSTPVICGGSLAIAALLFLTTVPPASNGIVSVATLNAVAFGVAAFQLAAGSSVIAACAASPRYSILFTVNVTLAFIWCGGLPPLPTPFFFSLFFFFFFLSGSLRSSVLADESILGPLLVAPTAGPLSVVLGVSRVLCMLCSSVGPILCPIFGVGSSQGCHRPGHRHGATHVHVRVLSARRGMPCRPRACRLRMLAVQVSHSRPAAYACVPHRRCLRS